MSLLGLCAAVDALGNSTSKSETNADGSVTSFTQTGQPTGGQNVVPLGLGFGTPWNPNLQMGPPGFAYGFPVNYGMVNQGYTIHEHMPRGHMMQLQVPQGTPMATQSQQQSQQPPEPVRNHVTRPTIFPSREPRPYIRRNPLSKGLMKRVRKDQPSVKRPPIAGKKTGK